MVRVRVVRITGGSFFIESDALDSVAIVKAQIKAAIGTPEARQLLIFQGQELLEGQVLGSCICGAAVGSTDTADTISDGAGTIAAVIHLVVRDERRAGGGGVSRLERCLLPAGREGICVRTLFTGGVCVIDAKPSELVQSIKAKIRDKLHVTGDHLLMFAGTELSDTRTLVSYGISTAVGSTLHLLPRLSLDASTAQARKDGATQQAQDCFAVGALAERHLDGKWFLARVLRCGGTPQKWTADIEYVDDGKIERDIDLRECRNVGTVDSGASRTLGNTAGHTPSDGNLL